ncbi:hypothetical protein AVEN_92919-1 [Araneus ventricosus]|uniref:Uncharacterized protein n=1 Tax=Araneus ventricosus TaxID=182803 RepID=A0A4Y2D288_ARAVE|nr:hypothetical protein AVEN_92919-1 [Araneus ventricosus]
MVLAMCELGCNVSFTLAPFPTLKPLSIPQSGCVSDEQEECFNQDFKTSLEERRWNKQMMTDYNWSTERLLKVYKHECTFLPAELQLLCSREFLPIS